jgi:hypothetical protein
MIDWSVYNPLNMFLEPDGPGGKGKFSIKRFCGAWILFTLLRMTERCMTNIIPAGNDTVFMHCFDLLCYTMLVLLIGATVKDILAFKNSTKIEETRTTDTSDSTTIHKSTETNSNG